MHTRLIFLALKEEVKPSNTVLSEKDGQETLESNATLLLLSCAWGQNAQLALHLPEKYVIKYAVVGSAFNLVFCKPKTAAVPVETRICPELLFNNKLQPYRLMFYEVI